MGHAVGLQSAEAFKSAFRAAPEVVEETGPANGLGIYGWKTPPMEGFKLPKSEDLILALHLGGSRCVRAVTDQGLSRSFSAPGLLTLLAPGRTAAFRTEGHISLVTLHIGKAAVDAVQAEQLSQLVQSAGSRFAFRDAFAGACMETLLSAARSSHAAHAHTDYVSRVAEMLVFHLARSIVKTEPGIDGISGLSQRLGCISLGELLTYIDRSLGRKLSRDELANRAGLSRSAFASVFRCAVGVSPHQYLNSRRIAVAKKLLRETVYDIGFIAQETGFSSQSHFTCLFHRVAGCTPARFRQEN